MCTLSHKICDLYMVFVTGYNYVAKRGLFVGICIYTNRRLPGSKIDKTHMHTNIQTNLTVLDNDTLIVPNIKFCRSAF